MTTETHRNVFLDTEFIDKGRADRPRLLSLALVAEDGKEFYAETDEDRSLAGDWVKQHVVPQFTGPIYSYPKLAEEIRAFIGDRKSTGVDTRIWAYFDHWDWVLFCGIFGPMVEMPEGFPHYCRDLKQLASMLRVPKAAFPKQPQGEHHALHDARWNLLLYRQLKSLAPPELARVGAIPLDF